ncbi:HBS1-like protein [Camelus dromedarius]|uniref:HBS1-like protein n=1 Tax=Camelus dromedarius TaxID=9838 RepID=A0A5N4DWA2_CAMDR|nr:HBS1-like protein [Camelus dromedarius]
MPLRKALVIYFYMHGLKHSFKNKLDLYQVNWQQERFQEITGKLGHFLKQAGFKENDVAFIPTSGLSGENLITRSQSSELTKWYKGQCLLEQIGCFLASAYTALFSMFPLRLPNDFLVANNLACFADQGSGFCVTGKIEAGYIQTGDRLLAMPPNETCTTKGIPLQDSFVKQPLRRPKCFTVCFGSYSFPGITLHDEPVDWAAAGDHVSLTLVGMDIIKINVGCVFCGPKEPIKACTRFRARILIFNIEVPITKGFPVRQTLIVLKQHIQTLYAMRQEIATERMALVLRKQYAQWGGVGEVLLHYQTVSEPAVIKRLISVLNKSTGEVTKKKPKLLTKGQNALVELQTQRPVALELYKDFKELGRFMLRYGGSTIAAGVVTEVI